MGVRIGAGVPNDDEVELLLGSIVSNKRRFAGSLIRHLQPHPIFATLFAQLGMDLQSELPEEMFCAQGCIFQLEYQGQQTKFAVLHSVCCDDMDFSGIHGTLLLIAADGDKRSLPASTTDTGLMLYATECQVVTFLWQRKR